jgi:hypothetical protein
MPYRYESKTIGRAALSLGIIGAGCVMAMTYLAGTHAPIPDALASIGGGAVGALATLLTTYAPSPIPGGRRAIDATVASVIVDPESPTATPPEPTVVSGPTGVVGGGGDATGN